MISKSFFFNMDTLFRSSVLITMALASVGFSSQAFGNFSERSYVCQETNKMSSDSDLTHLSVYVNVDGASTDMVVFGGVARFLPAHGSLTDVTKDLYERKHSYTGILDHQAVADASRGAQGLEIWADFQELEGGAKKMALRTDESSYTVWMNNIDDAAEYFSANSSNLAVMDHLFVGSAQGLGRFVFPKEAFHNPVQAFNAQLYIHSKFIPSRTAQGLTEIFQRYNRFDVTCVEAKKTENIPQEVAATHASRYTEEQQLSLDLDPVNRLLPSLETLATIQRMWLRKSLEERNEFTKQNHALLAAGGVVGLGLALSKVFRTALPIAAGLFSVAHSAHSVESGSSACAGPYFFENIEKLSPQDLQICVQGSQKFQDQLRVLQSQMGLQ